MIESLETRRLFSKIPLLVYPAPISVASDALSIINAPPAQVVASAAGNVGAGQAPSQAMLDVIEYHEGYSLSIYPNSSGVPTVGVGLKLDSKNATFAAAALSAAGGSYSDLLQGWKNIKFLFVSQHHPLGALKDTSPLWARFVEQNPSVADPVLTSTQASEAFSYAAGAKLATAAAFFGNQFWLLDRDPQIALVDFTYHVADLTKYTKLASQIQGNAQNATDYIHAAQQVTARALGSRQLAREDQDLVKHGEDVSSIVINPSTATLYLGESATVTADPTGAFGKSIISPAGDLRWTESVAGIVTMKVTKAGLELTSIGEGTTNLIATAGPASTTATTLITVTPQVVVTWDASGTDPDVDGTYSGTGMIEHQFYFRPAGMSELVITAVASGSEQNTASLMFTLTLSPFAFVPIQVGGYISEPNEYTLGGAGVELGSDDFSCDAYITAYNPTDHFVSGTFSTVPYGTAEIDNPPGSVSGSFSGVFTIDTINS